MKKLALVLLAGVVMTTAGAFAQDKSVTTQPTKVFTLSGTVTEEGKTLVSDKNDEWTVSNPQLLKGQDGREVTARCRLDPGKLSLHILSFKPEEVKYSANRGDSAFHR